MVVYTLQYRHLRSDAKRKVMTLRDRYATTVEKFLTLYAAGLDNGEARMHTSCLSSTNLHIAAQDVHRNAIQHSSQPLSEWKVEAPLLVNEDGFIAPSHLAAFFQDNADSFELPILTDKKLCQVRYVEFKLQEDVASPTWHHSVIGFVVPVPKHHHANTFHA